MWNFHLFLRFSNILVIVYHIFHADFLWETVDTVSAQWGHGVENSLSWLPLRCQELKCSYFWQIRGVYTKAKPALLPVCLYTFHLPQAVKTKKYKQQTCTLRANWLLQNWGLISQWWSVNSWILQTLLK